MAVLSGLEPKAVFTFFETLCAIPRASHNTEAVSEYLFSFAQQRGLKARRDEANNVFGRTPPRAMRRPPPSCSRLIWTC